MNRLAYPGSLGQIIYSDVSLREQWYYTLSVEDWNKCHDKIVQLCVALGENVYSGNILYLRHLPSWLNFIDSSDSARGDMVNIDMDIMQCNTLVWQDFLVYVINWGESNDLDLTNYHSVIFLVYTATLEFLWISNFSYSYWTTNY